MLDCLSHQAKTQRLYRLQNNTLSNYILTVYLQLDESLYQFLKRVQKQEILGVILLFSYVFLLYVPKRWVAFSPILLSNNAYPASL